MISNFWRAVQSAPEEVARWADWPVNENDLHARHAWLVRQKFGTDFVARLEGDPDYYDAKIAGWWVWGMAIWIGGGFCSGSGPWRTVDGRLVRSENAGRGIKRQRLHLGNAGQGIKRQRLHLGDDGRGIQRQRLHLNDYFFILSERLRRVRVCSGDWRRVLGPTPTTRLGLTGIVLDPPYVQDARDTVYNHDDANIADEVRQWAVEHGNDPLLRIAYCGYEDGFTWPDGWTALRWTAQGGFSLQRKNGTNNNRQREVVWFSPHCLKPETQASTLPLFAGKEGL
jgi:hypothetical protein